MKGFTLKELVADNPIPCYLLHCTVPSCGAAAKQFIPLADYDRMQQAAKSSMVALEAKLEAAEAKNTKYRGLDVDRIIREHAVLQKDAVEYKRIIDQQRVDINRQNDALTYRAQFNKGARYYSVEANQSFPYNPSRATIEVTRDYFEMLQSKARTPQSSLLNELLVLRNFRTKISTTLGVKEGEDIMLVAEGVVQKSEFNKRENKRLSSLVIDLDKRNSWQSKELLYQTGRAADFVNEINKFKSVDLTKQPAYIRLENENSDLRTILRQSNRYAESQNTKLLRVQSVLTKIGTVCSNRNWGDWFIALSIRDILSDFNNPKPTTGEASAVPGSKA